MNRLLFTALAVSVLLATPRSVTSQIVLLDSFNPANAGDICGLAQDPMTGTLWGYPCSGASIFAYSPAGDIIDTIARGGESSNDVDVAFTQAAMTFGGTSIPAGTLLFLNGETGPVEIYAIDKSDGTFLDTVTASFGVSHVVGGSPSLLRNSIFLVQDDVPGAADENRIAEIDPATGAVLNTFQVGSAFNVSYGDLDVSTVTGNLFIVSDDESRIAEYTPTGELVQMHALPSGMTSLSGLALDCGSNQAWASNTGGLVYHFSIPCGTSSSAPAAIARTFRLSDIYPNPYRDGASFALDVDRPQHVRLTVHDLRGREVAILHDGSVDAGRRIFTLDGAALEPGAYVVEAKGARAIATRRVMRVR